MESAKKYSAVIFDLDGLILDTETIARVAWRRAVLDFGAVLTDDIYRRLIGLATPDIEKVLKEVFGEVFPVDKVIPQAYSYFDRIITEDGISVKPGFMEVIVFLDKIRHPRAVATSSSRGLTLRKLAVSDLTGIFDIVVCGDQVKKGKPAPDIFIEAARQLDIPPEECLVFEDSDNGVRAAHKAGMAVIIIPDINSPSEEAKKLANNIFPSFYDVLPFLQAVIGGDTSETHSFCWDR